MTKRQLTVKISTVEESLARFKNAWEQADNGVKFEEPIEILSFENTATLMKTLSPKRLELLKNLHILGKSSIRKLSEYLDRDYSNVHQDVKSLYKTGLILEDDSGKYYVPWESIVTEFSLCRDTEGHRIRHRHYQDNSVSGYAPHGHG